LILTSWDILVDGASTKVPPGPPVKVDESMVGHVGGDFEDLPCFEVGTLKNLPVFFKTNNEICLEGWTNIESNIR